MLPKLVSLLLKEHPKWRWWGRKSPRSSHFLSPWDSTAQERILPLPQFSSEYFPLKIAYDSPISYWGFWIKLKISVIKHGSIKELYKPAVRTGDLNSLRCICHLSPKRGHGLLRESMGPGPSRDLSSSPALPFHALTLFSFLVEYRV